MSKTTIVLDEWEQALADAMGCGDLVPKGWLTRKQISERLGKSLPTAQRHTNFLISAGKAERKMFRVECNGIIRPVPHYRLKK